MTHQLVPTPPHREDHSPTRASGTEFDRITRDLATRQHDALLKLYFAYSMMGLWQTPAIKELDDALGEPSISKPFGKMIKHGYFATWVEGLKYTVLRLGVQVPDHWLGPACAAGIQFDRPLSRENQIALGQIVLEMYPRLIRLNPEARPDDEPSLLAVARLCIKPDGWTKTELVDQVTNAVGAWSPASFDRVRSEAGIKPPKAGGQGQQHRYSRNDLKQMIQSLESGTFRDRTRIACAWRELLRD